MIFNSTELREYITGNAFYDENGGLHRLTADQCDALKNDGISKDSVLNATTGIKISFDTDATNISFVTESGGRYEVYVDYLPVWQGKTQDGEKVFVPLQGGEKTVQIFFPHHTYGFVSRVELNGETYIKKHKFDKRFLFLGDSITQGYKSDYDSFCYAALISNFYNAETVNLGVGGAAFCPGVIEKSDFDPDVVFVAYGTNDFTRKRKSPEHFRSETERFLKKIKQYYGDKKVIVISPTWRADDDPRPAGNFCDIREFIYNKACELGFFAIDGFSLVPHDPQYFGDERLHPGDNGFFLYSLNLLRQIDKYIK